MVTLTPGASQYNISISTLPDNIQEDQEQFSVHLALAAPTDYAFIGTNDSANIGIMDNDGD